MEVRNFRVRCGKRFRWVFSLIRVPSPRATMTAFMDSLHLDAANLLLVLSVPGYRFLKAFLDRHDWFPSQKRPGLLDIGPRLIHVGRVRRVTLESRRLAQQLLQQRDEVDQVERRAPAAKVNDLISQFLYRHDRAAGDVVDIGEIPRLPPVAEQLYRHALVDPLDESEWRHIRPAGWPKHREIAKDTDVEAI